MGGFLGVTDLSALLRMVLAAVVSGAGAFGLRAASEALFIGDTPFSRVMDVAPPFFAAVLLYAAACRALRIEELGHYWRILDRRSAG